MTWRDIFFCLVLLAVYFSLADGQNAGEQGAPNAPSFMQNINPADYALLAADLREPFAFDGEINAEASSTGYTLTTSKGLERKNVSFLEVQQNIKILGMREDCSAWLSLYVAVFETPEEAVAYCQETFKEFGFTEDYQGFTPGYNGLKDPRLEGLGASSTRGHIVQYKNIVAKINEIGCASEVPPETVASLAKLWLDKVTRIKPADKPDLYLQPDYIHLSYDEDNNFMSTEIAADQQSVAVEVENRGSVEAKGVQVQLYLQKGDEYQPLGGPVTVGDIPAGSSKVASTFWDLEKKNVEGAVLMAQAFIPEEVDANEEDNTAAVKVNIYYAYNGNKAYSWIDDSYRFRNYGFNGRETEEMVEGLLATVTGNMKADANSLQILQRLFFPQTFTRFQSYLNSSMRQGIGGHCYGMSSTSALYFEDPSSKPVSKRTADMALEEASTNINIYQRAQMLPVWEAIMQNTSFFGRDYGREKCLAAVKGSLSSDRRPITVSFAGSTNNRWWGHAVLAYKLIEVEGRDPVIYIYDPNYNTAMSQPPHPMSQITIGSAEWTTPGYMEYADRDLDRIAAHRVLRDIPLDEVNSIVPVLKKSLYDMMEALKKANQFMAVLRCPADALFTDEQGRRVGMAGGLMINEIPGAEILSDGEVEIYTLPAAGKYTLSITATSSGKVGFDVIRPEDGSAGLTSFQDVSVDAGSQISGAFEPQGEIGSLQSGTGSVEPTLQGSVDLTDFSSGPLEGSNGEENDSTKEDTSTSKDTSISEGQSEEKLILEINTLGGVDNNPTAQAKFTINQPSIITKIRTYHWNYGSGQTPGMISLQDQSGDIFGPWQASGEPGMGGVPDAYWVVEPNADLPPGEYTIIDSDTATWSQNGETGGRGVAWVWGVEKQGAGLETNDQGATVSEGTCGWSGVWDTNFHQMVLQQSGNTVTGNYSWDDGRISATVSGNKLIGTWSESPSYSPPSDAGDFEFALSDDCKSFSGNWRYGSEGGWSGEWSGSRI